MFLHAKSLSETLAHRLVVLSTLVFVIGVGAAGTTRSMPAAPDLIERLRDSGELQHMVQRLTGARAKGVWTADPNVAQTKGSIGRTLSFDPASPDTFRALVILVDFNDQPASGGLIFGAPSDFEHLLFSFDPEDGHYSMTEFYFDNSYGTFFLQGQVVGWYRMPETYAYYVNEQNGFGPYPQNAQRMAEEAVLAADPAVDYSQFDADGNGWVDGIFVVHSGPGAEQTGSDDDIWSHQWSLSSTLLLDGVNISTYSTEPEEMSTVGLITMGVFGHEYGHVLGLPDLYDVDYSSSGIGDWSMMAGGSWNFQGRYPAYFDAWCKKELGFLSHTNIASNQADVPVPASYFEPIAFRVWQNGQVGSEYFLIENRRRTGNDKGIPGSGLLIYHIDESIPGNWDENHPLVAVEQADGKFQLEAGANQGDGTDVWSAATSPEFHDLTMPNTRKYSGQKTKAAVWNISPPDSVMTASFDISYSRPYFAVQSAVFSDSAFGNNNGIAEEGESLTFTFTVQNLWLDATNVVGTLSADNNDILFTNPSTNLGAVAGEGGTGNNNNDPLVFAIPADFVACIDSFYLEVTSDNPYSTRVFGFELQAGSPWVLLVDDDNGQSWEDYLEAELFGRRLPFDVYDKSAQGSPSGSLLSGYRVVLWLTGDARSDILSGADLTAMQSFLDAGGNLLLTGQSIVRELDTDNQSFLNNYLRATYDSDLLYPFMNGQSGAPIGDGLKIRLDASSNQTDPQTMTPINGAVADFVLPVGGTTVLSYRGDYKLVLLSFGFEGVSSEFATQGWAGRDTLFGRIMRFFEGETVSLNPIITTATITGESSLFNVVNHAPAFAWSVTDTTANPIVETELMVGTGNLCYNQDNRWAPAVLSGPDTSVTYGGLPLDDGAYYLLSVRVSNGETWSNWYELPFRMNSVADPGTPVEPVANVQLATGTPTLNVSNSFDPEQDTLTYEFEVYSDSLLANLVASASGIPEALPRTAWTVDVELPEDGHYFWRSRPFDGYEPSSFTGAASFYVNAVNQPPENFSLLDPPHDAAVLELFPRLTWERTTDNDAGDSVKYTLWTSLDSTFGTYTETANLPDTFRTLTYPVSSDTAYYWKVKAIDRSSAITWSSQTFRFFTGSQGCCVGIRGNVDDDAEDEVTVADITYLVGYLFLGGPEPACFEEGNADGDINEGVNVADLTYLVAHLFLGGPAPPSCP